MQVVVSSASGSGYGQLRRYDSAAGWERFGPPEISDPRGVRRRIQDEYLIINDASAAVWLLNLDATPIVRIELPAGLDLGGGAFGPDESYYVGSRSQCSIHKIDLSERRYCGEAFYLEGVSFPRGFAVLDDGRLIVASGTHPVHGGGRRALLLYGADGRIENDAFVVDDRLDPLDLALHGGYLYVTSEFPFGKDGAEVSLRCYDARTGTLEQTWSSLTTSTLRRVRKPRGIASSDDGTLFVCAQNCIAAIDVTGNTDARIVAEDERLAGQSLALLP